MTLRERITEEIRHNGPIPFSRFMELCLYEPELGYYSRAREKFGKAGDFYTSSDVHAVFGRLLARQFEEMWRALDSPSHVDIVELGPGRGLFAQDVLDWARKKFPEFATAIKYRLVESSPSLRERLAERFEAGIASGAVSILSQIADLPSAENSIIFGNEFFDALPLEIVDARGQVLVTIQDRELAETFALPDAQVVEYLDRYGIQPQQGRRVEAPLLAQGYMREIASRVKRGFVLFIDYGYTREELLRGRTADTVRAIRQHSISNSPYEAPGDQDITANVNFTAIRDAGVSAGLEPAALLTQSQFLIGIGETNQFADAFEECRLPQEQAKVTLQLKHLVTPAGMGELFHVLLLTKDVPEAAVSRLSGLSFAR